MAIILEAAYSKKLGLPNYSSHSYVVSIRTELSDLAQVEAESARLYALLQRSVDSQIKQVGFLPDATSYGMNGDAKAPTTNRHQQTGMPRITRNLLLTSSPATTGCARTSRRNSSSNWSSSTAWTRTRSKRSPARCSACRSRRSTGLQASGLIEELLERHGKPKARTATAAAAVLPLTGGTRGHEGKHLHPALGRPCVPWPRSLAEL